MIYTNTSAEPFMQSGSALYTASAMPKPYPIQVLSSSGHYFTIGEHSSINPGTVPIMIEHLTWHGLNVSADYFSGSVSYGDDYPYAKRDLTEQELSDVAAGNPMCFTPTPYGQSYYTPIRSLTLCFNLTGTPTAVSFEVPTQFDSRVAKRSFYATSTFTYREMNGLTASGTETNRSIVYYDQTPGSIQSATAYFR